ncbi:MAG: endo-alpha-N-acetylgalactosaminidase family protein [Acidobacteria bacterium]|nr:endo-alpha-N-acetylgalactosaminidase family protein [Acidobacteriota bacterium]
MLAAAPESAVMENSRLRVQLDRGFPRVLRYQVKGTGAELDGAPAGAAGTVELNGTPFTELDLEQPAPMRDERKYRVSATFEKEEARYRFRAFETYGVLSFDIVFRLDENSLVMRLERVEERGDYRLYTLYFPGQDLVTVKAGTEKPSVYRVEFDRTSADRGLIRWTRVYNGPLAGLEPDAQPEPTQWAMAGTARVFAILENNIPVFPVYSRASGTGKSAAAISLWNGPYHYRVNGEVVAPLVARVRLVGDENGDGKVDWIDGAIRLRETMAAPGPEYDDAFVYKVFCARPGDPKNPNATPTVGTTFAQTLDIVKKLYELTNHRKQIIYLVGWQHLGHDSKWPDIGVINPYLGGKDALIALMKQARNYNAVVSFHMNIDAAYKSSPAWDDRVICRKPDGGLMDWAEQNGETAYHVSHARNYGLGVAAARIDQLVHLLPVEQTIHLDAMRYTNESWEQDRFIDMTAELVAWEKIAALFRERGISITTEGAAPAPAFVGRLAGFWHLLGGKVPGKEYFWFLAHRRWAAGANTKDAERAVFGTSSSESVDAETDIKTVTQRYYLDTLLQQYYQRFEATGFADDGNVLRVAYSKNCVASYDRKQKLLRVEDGGVPIAMGTDRFIPEGNEILAYSKTGGKQNWTLPASLRGKRAEVFALTETGRKPGPKFQIAGESITFEAAAGQPYVITFH